MILDAAPFTGTPRELTGGAGQHYAARPVLFARPPLLKSPRTAVLGSKGQV